MTDFINFSKKKRIVMTESTRKVVEEAIGNVDEMTEDEAVQKINESKKAVAKKTKKGVKVKQSLNG
jgi:CRISPR/Cas system-associated exonuclease Cas4 (RecB family)